MTVRSRKNLVPMLAATAVLGTGAVTVAESATDRSKRAADRSTHSVGTGPVGAEEWMYLQRANADGTIPDAAVTQAIAKSQTMGAASAGSPELRPGAPGRPSARATSAAGSASSPPTRPTRGTCYIAAAAGGVWKTTNSGQTFASVVAERHRPGDGRGRGRPERCRLGRHRRAGQRRVAARRRRHLPLRRRRRDVGAHGAANSGSFGHDRDRPDRPRPRVRRGAGAGSRHRRSARPLPDRGRRRNLGGRAPATGRGRQDSIGAIDVAISPQQPRHRAGDDLGQDPRAGRPDLRQGLQALPVDRRRPHLDRRAAGAARRSARTSRASRSATPTSAGWASRSRRPSPAGCT